MALPAVERADWLVGVHIFWQTTPQDPFNHLDDYWGLRFKHYHDRFPDKPIEITEFGNSNVQLGLGISEAAFAQEYVEFYQELFNYPYIRSASSFIMSSPDPGWEFFSWRSMEGRLKPVVFRVGGMSRPPLELQSGPEP